MSTPPASKRRNMALLVGAIVLTLSVWFAGTAAVPALLLRFSAGAAMAGVYPVGMKLAGSWAVQRQQRWRPLIVSTRSMGIETSACLGSSLGSHGSALCLAELGAGLSGDFKSGA